MKMKGSFLIDDNKVVWLSNISEIVTWVKRGYVEHFDIIPNLGVCVIPGKPNIFQI